MIGRPPRASILIATKNRLEYLRLALASARDQSVPDIEIIVSDDGSTDGTVEYLRGVAREDVRVTVLTDNPAPGVFGNFGHLLAHSSGDAIAFLGDDDVLGKTFVERLLVGLDHDGVGAAYACFGVIDGDGRPNERSTDLLRRHHGYDTTAAGILAQPLVAALRGQLWLGACLFHGEVIRGLGFDARFGSAADLDLAIRLAERFAVYYVPELSWWYRDHAASHSRSRTIDAEQHAIAVLASRTFADSAAEGARRDALRPLLLRSARNHVAGDPARAAVDLRAYRALGGSVGDPRYLAVRAIRLMPAMVRRPAVSLAGLVWARFRRVLKGPGS